MNPQNYIQPFNKDYTELLKFKIMYSLIILLSRGRMSDYADFNSNGSVALHIIVILVIAGFFLYAYIKNK